MASTLVKSLRITPELWADVERQAKREGISANAFVVRCLESMRGCGALPSPVQTDAIDPYARWHDTQGRTPEQYYAERGEPLPEEYRAAAEVRPRNVAVGVLGGPKPFRGVTASGEPLPDKAWSNLKPTKGAK